MPKGSRSLSAKQRTELRRRRGVDTVSRHAPARTDSITIQSVTPDSLEQPRESNDKIPPAITSVRSVRATPQRSSRRTPEYHHALMGELKRIALTSSVVLLCLLGLAFFLR
jgi:hypothetical protein